MLRIYLAMTAVALMTTAGWGQCVTQSDIMGLGVETLDADYTIYYSPNHRSHAEQVAAQFPGVRDFIATEFGIDRDYLVSLLDEDAWNQVRAAKPECGFKRFGVGRNFFDLFVASTPVETDFGFEACLNMVEGLSPAERETLTLEAGTYPIDACYLTSRSSWMVGYGFLLGYDYFGAAFHEKFRWSFYLDSSIMTTIVQATVNPEIHRVTSSVARWFAHSFETKYGKPDVLALENNYDKWVETDQGLTKLWWYIQWFDSISDSLFNEFDATIAHSVRDKSMSEGTPNSALEFVQFFDEVKEGLESVLLDSEVPGDVPATIALGQNYPNPFNPTTTIPYSLEEVGQVSLVVDDILGRRVRVLVEGMQPPGSYVATFAARDLPSGVYRYRLLVGDFVKSRSMMLVR